MRALLVIAIAVAGVAHADKKIVSMTPGYKRELASCGREQGGLELMIARTRAVVATAPPDKAELESDLDRLAKGHEVVVAYCGEVAAMVKLLEDNANAAYKTVAKQIHARHVALGKARREAKKWLEELTPVTRKLIPRVNARRLEAIEERKPTGKFPSGRVVELPELTGAWKLGGSPVMDIAELTADGVKGTVTSYPFANESCEQQRKQFAAKAGDEPIAELELSAAAKEHGIEWALRYVRRDRTPHVLTKMCVPAGTGGFVAIADLTPPDQLAINDALANLMVTMLAAQLPKPAAP